MDYESTEDRRMWHDELLAKIEARFETRMEAETWYREHPLPGFSGLTARQLVDRGRAAEVVEYLAAVDAGVYS